ncbi:MAG: SDR family NAD(P)-dependent oxidoreductase [Candidatus Hydrogenedentes bacterium]|nr:SDR family NAD(P)-dependent oxidoreductase [Candidatus Hydrogenedentota bacterium]
MADMLSNQVAIVTGAGRGIGAAAAKLFAREGASVAVSDRDAAPAEAVVAEIQAAGGKAIACNGDITDPAFPAQLVAKCIEAFGKLNILVNNAGYTWDGMSHKMSDEQFQAMLTIHNVAPFRLIRAATPYMREAAKQEQADGKTPEPRCIINVSSVAGLHGNAGQINYSAAKAGIIGMTKTMAKEWGPLGIRCNTVAFGFIDTRLTASKESAETVKVGDQEVQLGVPSHLRDMALMVIPLARIGTPDEAAGGMVLLASPYASYITGHVLEVTGGMGI